MAHHLRTFRQVVQPDEDGVRGPQADAYVTRSHSEPSQGCLLSKSTQSIKPATVLVPGNHLQHNLSCEGESGAYPS
jgi:hypothetical protein